MDHVRYELKASDKTDATVADALAKFSKGDTGTYAVKGLRGTVNGRDGIIVESIAPAKANTENGEAVVKKQHLGYTIHDLSVGKHKF